MFNCYRCEGFSTCDECIGSYYLDFGTCTQTCNSATYPNNDISPNECSPCTANCLLCDNSTSCNLCTTNYYIDQINGLCVLP